MWYPAEIVMKSYLPFELEEGMLFVNKISVGTMEPYVELWTLEEIPEDMDEFMAKHGAPIELLIIDDQDQVLATESQIGWWDEGEHTEDLRDITLDDINLVLREWEGWLCIELEHNDEYNLIPTLHHNKVVLCLDQEENDEDWDVTLEEGLEEEF